MLVIRRREGESVLAGDVVEVRVLEITGSRVKLGFVAKPDVVIVRQEVAATGALNREAARSGVRENANAVCSIFR